MQSNRSNRGVAMSETVLILPVILLVLVMLLFYGWSMMRLQRASVQDRYETWRQVYHADGPRVLGPDQSDRTTQINQTFWGGDAQTMTYSGSDKSPNQPRDRVKEKAQRESDDAGQYVQTLIEDHLPKGRTVGFHTQLSSFSKVVDELNGPIGHRHTRIANEWKYVNAVRKRDDDKWVESGYRIVPQTALRDTFFRAIDRRLEPIVGGKNDKVARVVRWYYFGKPTYRGPDVDYQFPNQD